MDSLSNELVLKTASKEVLELRIASTKDINLAEVNGMDPMSEFTSKLPTYSATLRMSNIAAAGFVEGSAIPAYRNCRSHSCHKWHGSSTRTHEIIHYSNGIVGFIASGDARIKREVDMDEDSLSELSVDYTDKGQMKHRRNYPWSRDGPVGVIGKRNLVV